MRDPDPLEEDEEEEEEEEGTPPPPPPAQPYSVSLSAQAAGTMGQPAPKVDIKGKETRALPRVSWKGPHVTTPLTPDDIDEDTIIGPSKAFVRNVYASTARMNPRHLAIAESAARDALALQSAAQRDALTASFKRQGVNWQAGYSSDLLQTPLGHAIHPTPLPAPGEPLSGGRPGQVVRTVNPHLLNVLELILPPAFKEAMTKTRGKHSRLLQVCIYYLPGPQENLAGFFHEFINPRNVDQRFYLYLQTSVGRAPVSILDEVLGSLEGGLPQGESADDYTVAETEETIGLRRTLHRVGEEVEQSIQQVSSSFRSSVPVRAAASGWGNLTDFLPALLDRIDRFIVQLWRKVRKEVLTRTIASRRPRTTRLPPQPVRPRRDEFEDEEY